MNNKKDNLNRNRKDLKDAYKSMSKDIEREKEAEEWAVISIADIVVCLYK